MQPSTSIPLPEGDLEHRISAVGRELGETLAEVLESVPGAPHRPQHLATTLGLDKVLTSRVIRAAKHQDPIAIMQLAPGPDPMRRLLRAAKKHGAPESLIDSATDAINNFEKLIREEAGDRGTLGAIIASWLPDARAEFESRQKQAAFKTMSLLKGVVADVNIATVLLHPAEDGENIDILWIMGLGNLTRLRPRAPIKFVSRRVDVESQPRRSTTIAGDPIEGSQGVLLDQFCRGPLATLDLHRAGDVNHYMVAGEDYGLKSKSDLIIAEASYAELPRRIAGEPHRKGYFFAEIGTPARSLIFDAFVHRDIYPGRDPSLAMYDTSFEGIANVNDRSRDVDRLDLLESIQPLGQGLSMARTPELPRHVELLESAFQSMNWNPNEFRGYRCRIEFPIYGSQVTMAFDVPGHD